MSSKGGYIPEDGERMISRTDKMKQLVELLGVPEADIIKESGHCLHPAFLAN